MGGSPDGPTESSDGARPQPHVYDFDDGNGLVAAHRHLNGGGWVADSAVVSDSAFVGPDALVFGNARVSDSASVADRARVRDRAEISGQARVAGHADVRGDAQVAEEAEVCEDASVSGRAVVSGSARVTGSAQVKDDGVVIGMARVGGEAVIDQNEVVTDAVETGPSPGEVERESRRGFPVAPVPIVIGVALLLLAIGGVAFGASGSGGSASTSTVASNKTASVPSSPTTTVLPTTTVPPTTAPPATVPPTTIPPTTVPITVPPTTAPPSDQAWLADFEAANNAYSSIVPDATTAESTNNLAPVAYDCTEINTDVTAMQGDTPPAILTQQELIQMTQAESDLLTGASECVTAVNTLDENELEGSIQALSSAEATFGAVSSELTAQGYTA
jgi:hypothetical protein